MPFLHYETIHARLVNMWAVLPPTCWQQPCLHHMLEAWKRWPTFWTCCPTFASIWTKNMLLPFAVVTNMLVKHFSISNVNQTCTSFEKVYLYTLRIDIYTGVSQNVASYRNLNCLSKATYVGPNVFSICGCFYDMWLDLKFKALLILTARTDSFIFRTLSALDLTPVKIGRSAGPSDAVWPFREISYG